MRKVFGGSLFVCGLALAAVARSEDKVPVRLYTNEDLERVAPYRDQTGVASVPSVAASFSPASPEPRDAGRRPQGEAYWRREAEGVRERVRALEARAAEIRQRLAESRQAPAVFGRRRPAAPATAGLEARLHSLEREIREVQEGLEDRARREGALPGWLR